MPASGLALQVRMQRESSPLNRTQEGAHHERLAAEFLIAQGLRLIERNYRTRVGEIDLIGVEGSELVFVEVRVRRAGSWLQPFETLDPPKLRRIEMTARLFLRDYRGGARSLRFDFLGWDGRRWSWIKNCWTA